MADTMLSFSKNLSSTFLTEDELKKICPMAFKTEPTNPDVSDKYTMATTMDVVNDMAQIGWFPTQAKQCRGKKNSKGIRSYHMISFQNPDIKILKDGEIEAYPTIILQNSHDSFSSFKFMCGIYVLLCSNGLCITEDEYANVSIRHINYDFKTLRETINRIICSLPKTIENINSMKNKILTENEKQLLSKKVIELRKNLSENEVNQINSETINDILVPLHNKQYGKNDLWTIFNICQEKLINGFFLTDNKNKLRKQRKITSPTKDIKYNQLLWEYAISLIKQ